MREPMDRCRPGRVAAALFVMLCWPTYAVAESWCADPLWVHEWGVHVFGASGAASSIALPSYFYTTPPTGDPASVREPVRHLPVDSGARALPVVQVYTAGAWGPDVPFALEVGFAQGDATAWFPQVDRFTTSDVARSAAARDARDALLTARAQRSAAGSSTPLPGDPTRQLAWDHLVLSVDAPAPLAKTDVAWVNALRAVDGALWVGQGELADRFVFYEGKTRETPLLTLERGDSWAPDRAHYVLRNVSDFAVHDVFVVRRTEGRVQLFHAPKIPSRSTAGFLLEGALSSAEVKAQTRDALRAALVDPSDGAPPKVYRWDMDHCVMQRDPALPVVAAEGHRLYEAEADVLLDVWGARFFDAEGTTIVYREDTGYLDAVMPLSVYTDMFHSVVLQRAGLVVWEGVDLDTVGTP